MKSFSHRPVNSKLLYRTGQAKSKGLGMKRVNMMQTLSCTRQHMKEEPLWINRQRPTDIWHPTFNSMAHGTKKNTSWFEWILCIHSQNPLTVFEQWMSLEDD